MFIFVKLADCEISEQKISEFADDSSVIGDISVLKTWLDKLLVIGIHFGYYPEPSNSILIVKKSLMSSAEQLFNGSSVSIVQSSRFLGGVIGDQAGIEAFVTELDFIYPEQYYYYK